MTRLRFIILAAACFYVCLAGDDDDTQTCGSNEVSISCYVDCPSDYCPKSRCTDQSYCPQPTNHYVCEPGCKCGFNMRRANNGTCIPVEDCPPFQCNGDNEEYDSCPPLCSDDCSNVNETGECRIVGRIGIRKPCNPACRCKKYYCRKNGKCVPYKQCTKCPGKNTEYTDCSNPCPPRTCGAIVARYDCTKASPCKPGCACKKGYLKRDSDSACVRICDCPEMSSAAQCQGKNK